jgi:hypothetical protein
MAYGGHCRQHRPEPAPSAHTVAVRNPIPLAPTIVASTPGLLQAPPASPGSSLSPRPASPKPASPSPPNPSGHTTPKRLAQGGAADSPFPTRSEPVRRMP